MANVSVLDMETGLYPVTPGITTPVIQVSPVGWNAGGAGGQAGTGVDHTKGKSHTHE